MVISQAGIECIVIPGNDVENVKKNTMLMLNVLTEKVLGYQMMLNVLGRSGPLVNVEKWALT